MSLIMLFMVVVNITSNDYQRQLCKGVYWWYMAVSHPVGVPNPYTVKR